MQMLVRYQDRTLQNCMITAQLLTLHISSLVTDVCRTTCCLIKLFNDVHINKILYVASDEDAIATMTSSMIQISESCSD